jgi:hypothetical protein
MRENGLFGAVSAVGLSKHSRLLLRAAASRTWHQSAGRYVEIWNYALLSMVILINLIYLLQWGGNIEENA